MFLCDGFNAKIFFFNFPKDHFEFNHFLIVSLNQNDIAFVHYGLQFQQFDIDNGLIIYQALYVYGQEPPY